MRDICNTPDIDAVEVLIANRARWLPGSPYALDGPAAVTAFRVLIARCNLSKPVSVRLACHRALDANDLLQSIGRAQRCLLCVGEKDATARRYFLANALPNIEMLILPRTSPEVSATEVREALASEHPPDVALLPAELSRMESAAYWRLLRRLVRPMPDVVLPRIRRQLKGTAWSLPASVALSSCRPADPEFLFTRSGGTSCVVKYAGETPVTGRFDREREPAPKRRLAVERRALRRVGAYLSDAGVRVPELLYWDARTKTLITTDPRGEPCSSVGDRGLATREIEHAARAYARLHAWPVQREPLWGTWTQEVEHWDALCGVYLSPDLHPKPPAAHAASLYPQRVLCALVRADDLRWDGHTIAFRTMERASYWGDPALDLALFMSGSGIARQEARVRAFASAYTQTLATSGICRAVDSGRIKRARALTDQVLPNQPRGTSLSR